MLEQYLGYELKRVQHALRLRFDHVLREEGLTTPQFAALNVIAETPGLSGKKVANRCFVTSQTMNLILANLESVGLIVRRPHPEYGRVLQTYLTPAGEDRLQKCSYKVRAIEDRMEAAFTYEQRLQFLDALKTCITALEADAERSADSEKEILISALSKEV